MTDKKGNSRRAGNSSRLNVRRLNRAIRRQQTVQRSRSLAWCLFVASALTAVSAWGRVLGTLARGGSDLAWLAVIIALLMTALAIKMLQAGRRFNHLLRDSETLMARAEDREERMATQWGFFLPWTRWWS